MSSVKFAKVRSNQIHHPKRALKISFRPHTTWVCPVWEAGRGSMAGGVPVVREHGQGSENGSSEGQSNLWVVSRSFLKAQSPRLPVLISWFSFLLFYRLCKWSHRRHLAVINFMSSSEVLFNSRNIWLTCGLCSWGKYLLVICRCCYPTPPIWRRNSAYALRH